MKDTLVFVHGMCHGSWCWEEQFIPYFEKLGYHCIAFNLPGHEMQGRTRRISYSLNDYVQVLHREVAKLSTPPIIIGHSMGGMIVQHFLKTGSCKKAVLMSSVPPSGVLMASIRVLTKYPGAIPFLFQMNLLGVFNKYPQLMFNEMELCAKYAPRMCSESFIAYLGLMLPISHKSSAPMLVVGGSEDNLITVQEFSQTAKHYGAELAIIEGGSHDLMLDADAEKTAKVIQEWI